MLSTNVRIPSVASVVKDIRWSLSTLGNIITEPMQILNGNPAYSVLVITESTIHRYKLNAQAIVDAHNMNLLLGISDEEYNKAIDNSNEQ